MIETIADALTWHDQEKEKTGMPYSVLVRTRSGAEFVVNRVHPFQNDASAIVLEIEVAEGDTSKKGSMFLAADAIESFTIVV